MKQTLGDMLRELRRLGIEPKGYSLTIPRSRPRPRLAHMWAFCWCGKRHGERGGSPTLIQQRLSVTGDDRVMGKERVADPNTETR